MIYLGNSPVGVAVGVAGFTQYEKKSLTFPNASNSNSYEAGAVVSCSFVPKLVVFYGGTSTSGNIIGGCYNIPAIAGSAAGGTRYINAANNSDSVSGTITRHNSGTLPTSSANACRYFADDGKLYITRVSSNGYWSKTDTYTFEIWG